MPYDTNLKDAVAKATCLHQKQCQSMLSLLGFFSLALVLLVSADIVNMVLAIVWAIGWTTASLTMQLKSGVSFFAHVWEQMLDTLNNFCDNNIYSAI